MTHPKEIRCSANHTFYGTAERRREKNAGITRALAQYPGQQSSEKFSEWLHEPCNNTDTYKKQDQNPRTNGNPEELPPHVCLETVCRV